MRAGKLRHRITIESPTLPTADSYGAQTETWSTFAANVAAEVSVLSGVEAFRAKQVQPEASSMVTLRYRSGVTAAMRFLWGTRYLYPVSVVEDEKKTEMVCLCRETL